MGCDIHCWAEVKVEGRWHAYNQIQIDRDYGLFGAMAGVRRSEDRMFPTKGVPTDLSFVVSLEVDRWSGDAHNHSWLDLEEIVRLNQCFPAIGVKYQDEYFFGGTYPGFAKYREDFPSFIEDVRWVFWFDN